MEQTIGLLFGMLAPLTGTTLGAAAVFVTRREPRPGLQQALLGLASGVMMAASVWSLLLPAIDMAERQGQGVIWLPATAGFLLGIGFLLGLDRLAARLRPESAGAAGNRSSMLMLAVTLHNLPEGMAVGVVLAGMLSGSPGISPAAAMALTAGVAIQNFPEGAIISMPMAGRGSSRAKAFGWGFLSGLVEPVGAGLTLLLTRLVTPVLPYILAFAAGAMIYVVVEELIPECQEGERTEPGTIGVGLGFALMMLLDVALG